MKLLECSASALLTLTLVGCGSPLKTAATTTGRLDCPAEHGQLTRVSAAADGKSCLYKIGSRTEVQLRLLPLMGSNAEATLAKLEDELKAETQGPATTSKLPAEITNSSSKDAAQAIAQAEQDTADHGASSEEAADGQAWDANTIEAKVDAKLREKGIATSSTSTGDHAEVNLPGIHITAGDDKADVKVGPIHVNANGDTATVRSFEAVRMRGEAFSNQQRGLRAMLVYAGEALGNGYKYVGYAASGPQSGPIVVATVKSRSEDGFHGDIYGDIKRLVRRNGGT